MITIDRGKLKFLRAGRTILVPNDSKHRPGRTYKLRIQGQARARWELYVLAVEGAELRIRLAGDDKPHLLAARSEYGYTSDPAKAMPHEPEAIEVATLDRYAEQARQRREAAQASHHGRSVGIRVKEAAARQDFAMLGELGSELLRIAAAGGTISVAQSTEPLEQGSE